MTEEYEFGGKFTYEIPNAEKYLRGMIALLQYKKENELADLLKGCTCKIVPSTQFSHQRWDAFYTVIHLQAPISKLDFFSEQKLKKICQICDDVMPKEAGYDVMDVRVSPLLDDIQPEASLSDDLEKIVREMAENIVQILPPDIRNKGDEMAEVYLYLYCIENSLRLFIENVAKQKYGEKWFENLQLSRSIRDSITVRKELEKRNGWLSIRGNSDLFYVDFKDLGSIISQNWDLFKQHFPDLQWIDAKIAELAQCRNLVAHNSYVGNHEKEMIRLYYRSILKQIGLLH